MKKETPETPEGPVVTALRASLAARPDVGEDPQFAATAQAALAVAVKVDMMDAFLKKLAEDAIERGSKAPSMDNASLPTLLKYLTALRLTPDAVKLAAAAGSDDAEGAALRGIEGGAA